MNFGKKGLVRYIYFFCLIFEPVIRIFAVQFDEKSAGHIILLASCGGTRSSTLVKVGEIHATGRD